MFYFFAGAMEPEDTDDLHHRVGNELPSHTNASSVSPGPEVSKRLGDCVISVQGELRVYRRPACL